MDRTVFLVGDVNLVGVDDPAVPFRQMCAEFKKADVVFGNLECCLFDQEDEPTLDREGFFASERLAGEALIAGGFNVVGNANNVNFGANAILASNRRLDDLGISRCGAGRNRADAEQPTVVVRNGIRYGFLQRTAVYWPTDHEAGPACPGVAVIKAHTAYQPPTNRKIPGIPAFNRPGIPPIVITWADSDCMAGFKAAIADLRTKCDLLVVSCHWGLYGEVLSYMTEYAHAAIDAGADIVIGHGPHEPLSVEVYGGKPIFFGLGSFAFHSGHGGLKHGDWVGMLVKVTLEHTRMARVAFRFVRHNASNETVPRSVTEEPETLQSMIDRSSKIGSLISVNGDEAVVSL